MAVMCAKDVAARRLQAPILSADRSRSFSSRLFNLQVNEQTIQKLTGMSVGDLFFRFSLGRSCCGCFRALAPLVHRNVLQRLLDVLTTAFPCWLAALLAVHFHAHDFDTVVNANESFTASS